MNFQMFKLLLEKAEEPEIKLPTPAESQKKQNKTKQNKTNKQTKKQENFRRLSTFASLTMPLTCVDHNKLWKILQEMGIPDPLICLSEKSVYRSGSNS